MQIFLIFGYGVPKDISTNQNYITYLNTIFNRIYSSASGKRATIIFCGGPTNCIAPFKGTEAKAMKDHFAGIAKRNKLGKQTGDWKYILESRSLSTLENLLFAKEIIKNQKLRGELTIFCEYTRKDRVKTLARKIFTSKFNVDPIDFDTSEGRYSPEEVIKDRTDTALKVDLWALKNDENLKKHHEYFKKKIALLRGWQKQGMSHEKAVMRWYKEYVPLAKEELM